MLYDESGVAVSRKIRHISCLTCVCYCLRAVVPVLFLVFKLSYPAFAQSDMYNFGLIVIIYGMLEIAMILVVLHILGLSRQPKRYTNSVTESFIDIVAES
jgi:hypothetical protein